LLKNNQHHFQQSVLKYKEDFRFLMFIPLLDLLD